MDRGDEFRPPPRRPLAEAINAHTKLICQIRRTRQRWQVCLRASDQRLELFTAELTVGATEHDLASVQAPQRLSGPFGSVAERLEGAPMGEILPEVYPRIEIVEH